MEVTTEKSWKTIKQYLTKTQYDELRDFTYNCTTADTLVLEFCEALESAASFCMQNKGINEQEMERILSNYCPDIKKLLTHRHKMQEYNLF